jgi:hypothetical protein
MWGNGVGCSKKAGIVSSTKNEVDIQSLVQEYLKEKVNIKIQDNRRLTVSKSHEHFFRRP